MQELLDSLLESEICEFFEDATNATEGNFRNGYYPRTINTAYGALSLKMPRDRLNQFKTNLLKPYQRTTNNITEMIQRLYVHGMTEREIVDHLLEEFGLSLSRESIKRTVNKVLGDAISFNTRVISDCAIVYLDGTYVPIKKRHALHCTFSRLFPLVIENLLVLLYETKSWFN